MESNMPEGLTPGQSAPARSSAGEPAWRPKGDRLYFWKDSNLVQVMVRADDRFEALGERMGEGG